MPHAFDCEGLADLLDDATTLSSLSSRQQRRLAPWAAPSKSRNGATGDSVVLTETLREASIDAQVQAELADTILQRLIGSVDVNLSPRPVILIVDDSPDARDTTALLLEQAGFRAITAANGLEALIVAHFVRPVVVLLDLMMPILDGLQTARLLSESPSTWRVKVIAYSGRTDMFSRRLPGTFTAILAKPTTPEELLTLVQMHAGAPGGQ